MVRVGFDDFATQMLGPRKEVNLPRMGQKVEAGKEAFSLKTAGRMFNIASPVGGTVSAVNPLYRAGAQIGTLAPYEEGWVYIVEPSKRFQASLKKLLWGDKTVEWMQDEAETLFSKLKPEATAASGGTLDKGFMANLPDADRAGLVDDFLMK
jgi:glycine cleavage system H protein